MVVKTLLVCGSRRWGDKETVFKTLDEYYSRFEGQLELIHGGASCIDAETGEELSADALAEQWARINFIQTEIHRPNYEKYPPKYAPLKRNEEMLDTYPDGVVAFWDGESKGTSNVINGAHRRGIPVEVVTHESDAPAERADDSGDRGSH